MRKDRPRKVKATVTNSHLWSEKQPDNTQIVGIKWRDIQYVDNWNEDDEVAPARHLLTIGYLLYVGPDPKDSAHSITVIAGTYNHDADKWADFTVFPSTVIRETVAITKKRGGK